MMVKIHQRIYSEEDLEAVDRAFEEACVTFQRELDAYLAATPRKPRNKKHRRAKSVTPSAGRRGRMRMTGKGNSSNSNNNNNNNDDNDDEDDEEHFRLMLNSSPTVTKRRRLLQMKNDADIDLMPIPSSPLVSPTNELESNYIPLLINEESTEDEDEDEDVGDTRLETNQTPESNVSDVSNDQENVMPPSMEQSISSVPNKTSLDKPSFIKEELTFSNSADVVKLASNEYEPYFDFPNGRGTLTDNQLRVDLVYPNEQVQESFILCTPMSRGRQPTTDGQMYSPIHDLIQTIEVFCRYAFRSRLARQIGGEMNSPLMELLIARSTRDGERFITALKRYTELVQGARAKGRITRRRALRELPFELVCHITYQVYSRIVAPQVESLQNYKAFSNFVYGEINPPLMREIIQKARISHDSVFVDLGCGIGNVVLHVAAHTGCEAYGVEIMKTPARLAELQLREFQSRIRGYGFDTGIIKILQGDFLELEAVAQILKRADVLLVNNYAFDAQLNQRLLQLFLDLKEGTRIISLRNFVPLDHKITVRNAGSAESILSITSHTYPSGSVSWTNSGGQYFIQTVDRTAVQRFWQSMERSRPSDIIR